MELSVKLSLDKIQDSVNVAELLSEADRSYLGQRIVSLFDMDRTSRLEWEQRMERAHKLALQVAEKKTFPWPGASNVKFPLITIAALQYHARAYPALVDTPDLVHCLPVGDDPDGAKDLSSRRIAEHMSWQLTEEDEEWEAEFDRALLVQPIMGCAFKKSYFDSFLKHNVSELVLPQDLVVSYYTKNLQTCPRATHILPWSSNDLEERIRQGFLLPTDTSAPKVIPAPFGLLQDSEDESQGMTAPNQDPEQPQIILEQHTWYDLDGDGYKEPYVCFVKYDTSELLGIRPRFLPSGVQRDKNGKILHITPEIFFTKIPFIPSPDGGFYDLGFGHLLGPLSESIDSAINQLIDAGTMHNAGGGFLGKGARIKGGSVSIRPNEWVRVDSPGDDLRKSIVELPRREPSMVLFQLLQLLIDFGQRVAGAPDIIQGQNPGQNTPAETSRNMLEQGIQVFNGIYKRTYRAFKAELRLLYRLNSLYLEDSQEFLSPISGFQMKVLREDYKLPSSAVRPAADPHYMSQSQRMNQANALMQAASTQPGYDLHRVNQFFLDAWKIPGKDQLHPDPKGPNAIPSAPDPKLQIAQMKLEQDKMEFQLMMRLKMFELMEEHELNKAKIKEMEAKATSLLENIDDADVGHTLAMLNSAIAAEKLKQAGKEQGISVLKDLMQMSHEKQMQKADHELQRSLAVQPAAPAATQAAPTAPTPEEPV